jgi:hypothetical protein
MARMKASVKTGTVYLGRASSGAISDDRELAVGVLADWLPYGRKWAKCQVGMGQHLVQRNGSGERIRVRVQG